MGGPIQPPAHVQTLSRLIDHGMNPQAILDAPRWKIDGASIDLERSAAAALRDGLAALGHRIEDSVDSYMDFGAGQFVVRCEGGYACGSDPRRDGQAAGY
jgi:gamma-glutamyltranspeptidase/glutathione hydrolase